MVLFSQRSLTWAAITAFALVLFVQTASYVHLILVQDSTSKAASAETDAEADVANRDLAPLRNYLLSLSALYVALTLTKWRLTSRTKYERTTGQQHRSNQWRSMYCSIRRLLSVQVFGCSLGQLVQASVLIFLNALQLFQHTLEMDSSLSTRTAQLALVNVSVAVALSARVSILWRGYGIEQTLKYHQWFAWIGATEALYHSTFYSNKMYQKHKMLFKFMSDVRYPSGLALIISITVLLLGSHSLIRAYSYRLFRLMHLVSFAVIITAGMLHHWIFIVFYASVIFAWMVDQWQLWKNSAPARIVTIEALPGNIVKLQVQPSFDLSPADFHPGQFAFLSLRGSFLTSRIAPNAFSISRIDYTGKEPQIFNCPSIIMLATKLTRELIDNMIRDEEEQKVGEADDKTGHALLTFYIRAKGARTLAFRQLGLSGDQAKMERLRVSRPVGYPSLDFASREYSDFEAVVLIAEGIGITPWLSLLQHFGKKGHHIVTQNVTLIWTMRNAGIVLIIYHRVLLSIYRA